MIAEFLARGKASRDDRGITLVELLVAMMLLGVLLVVVSGLYISTMRTVTLSKGLTGNTKVASNAMNAVSRSIRAATNNPIAASTDVDPAFVVAKRDEVVLYAYVNLESSEENPVMIRYRIDRTTGKLEESRWPAQQLAGGKWQFPSTSAVPTYTRTIAETIAPYSSGDHPFTYLRTDGTAISAPVSGLSKPNRELISSVRLTLTAQTSLTDATNPVTLTNTVGMPNLGFVEDLEL